MTLLRIFVAFVLSSSHVGFSSENITKEISVGLLTHVSYHEKDDYWNTSIDRDGYKSVEPHSLRIKILTDKIGFFANLNPNIASSGMVRIGLSASDQFYLGLGYKLNNWSVGEVNYRSNVFGVFAYYNLMVSNESGFSFILDGGVIDQDVVTDVGIDRYVYVDDGKFIELGIKWEYEIAEGVKYAPEVTLKSVILARSPYILDGFANKISLSDAQRVKISETRVSLIALAIDL